MVRKRDLATRDHGELTKAHPNYTLVIHSAISIPRSIPIHGAPVKNPGARDVS